MLDAAPKRSLAATLCVLEEMLIQAEWILSMGGYSGITYNVTYDINPSVRDKILKTVSHIKEKVKSIAEQFDLEQQTKEANRQLTANLFYCWEVQRQIDSVGTAKSKTALRNFLIHRLMHL